MLCQNCKSQDATIHLEYMVNNEKRQLNLCQNCFQQLKESQQNNTRMALSQDPYGFGLLENFFRNMQQSESQTPPTQNGGQNGMNGQPPRDPNSGLLGEFGYNLTQAAKKGEFDPVIGRDEEIQRVVEILNRRTKNNPVLIGEAGVGKTAVVEGLAQKIVNGDVPQKLLNKQIIRLDVASLVQGTGIRGQFEERMKKLIDEVRENENVILFIDEVHEIVGAGNAGDGNMDAGNILKPALARGELQLVGATTLNEYRVIEKDAALERRMQPVKVDEPSLEESISILKGSKAVMKIIIMSNIRMMRSLTL